MLKFIYLTKLQNEIMQTNSGCNLVTAQAGSGTTWGLLFKAISYCLEAENRNVSFFKATQAQICEAGGILDTARSILKGCNYRLSLMSNILTFSNGSKIKFQSCGNGVEPTMGLCRDIMLFDEGCDNRVIQHHVIRAGCSIIVDNVERLQEESSWIRSLGLLNNGIGGWKLSPVVNHIKVFQRDNIHLCPT
jgi:hypothetical protein